MKTFSKVLAIETSCDDTSVAVVDHSGFVHACLVASQDLVHEPFGGVVPEIASRNHVSHLLPLIDKAVSSINQGWDAIDGIAVTSRPGLIGSLIVGLVTAKTLALAYKKPFIGVHHIEGHLMAPFLKDDKHQGPDFFNEPFLALIVSGGHTQLYKVNGFASYETLGETIDDAAGEAFDKFAKMMGLGYPGGVVVDRLASLGDKNRFAFPRPLLNEDNFSFSFSGLKSSAQRLLEPMSALEREQNKQDLCASYQQAIVDVLVTKLARAMEKFALKHFIVSGGVSANSALRQAVEALAQKHSYQMAIPPLRYCTDNAAMIGLVGLNRLQKGERSTQDLAPKPRAEI